MKEYPAMLRLQGKRCLVVGGGAVAERKIASLLEAGALVTVISPSAAEAVEKWAETGRIVWHRGCYGEQAHSYTKDSVGSDKGRPGKEAALYPDLSPYLVVFAATDNPQVNERVRADADEAGKLVSVADKPDGGSLVVPAVVRRGKLTLAVSTSGASPALSAAIRRDLLERYGPEYESYVDFLAELRELARRRVGDMPLRHELLRELPHWRVLERIAAGTYEVWKTALLDRLRAQNTEEAFAAAWMEADRN
ncbi:bifunctional precorrin-2 dehydrogenase/sirohydrochlorin ferrochelatase [Paenibacillus sp. UNC499MF]|uniref:precorrin-2 dehydrogenase/sirohydrochlorin ferrochelatase family protein n=1 Tax=Paenibacillus sp. UNC499MF TaxID=1502751 RepID=UPI00089F9DCA|nr:bifunctional precorrin-2 dehydrogenase/sirohydrochlorin ferrochelatase [Paenibacillus sp. UNC499MF]SEG34653.1 precorrin-2 dehydrogenase / sirohydrochlorin ferrochelatase [Paenibacillus sp. UNC499MF]